MPPKGWRKNGMTEAPEVEPFDPDTVPPCPVVEPTPKAPVMPRKIVDHPGFNISCGQCQSTDITVHTSSFADFTMACGVCGNVVTR